MGPDRRTHGCEKCRRGESDTLEQIGVPVKRSFFDGKASEIETHFRCGFCGAEWSRIVESGLSKGTFWNPVK